MDTESSVASTVDCATVETNENYVRRYETDFAGAIGVDLGSTRICVAVVKGEEVKIIEFEVWVGVDLIENSWLKSLCIFL